MVYVFLTASFSAAAENDQQGRFTIVDYSKTWVINRPTCFKSASTLQHKYYVNITHLGIIFEAKSFICLKCKNEIKLVYSKTNLISHSSIQSLCLNILTQNSHSSRLEHQAFFTTSCFYNHAVRWWVQLVINAISFTEGHV